MTAGSKGRIRESFPTTRESGQEGLVSMSVQEYVDRRLDVLEAQRVADMRLVEIEKFTIEKRLTDLNGEAGRLKTVLDASVPQQVFNNYVSSQRDKDDEKERASRERFDAYAKNTATAFATFAEENARRYNAITRQIAFFVGGGTVLIAGIQLWINFTK